ncbi:MAG: TolC family protein [Myxococcales bacterium]|nr:TolC family protein [Myxococcales bacterium]
MMRSLSTLGLVALAGAAWAEPLTEATAIERALARHPALAAAGYQVDAAEAGADRAGAAWLPRVEATARVVAQGPTPTLHIDTGLTPPGAPAPLSIEREIGQTVSASVGLEAGWRALDFGSRSAYEAAARAGVDVARADARDRAATVAWAVRQSLAAAVFFADVVRTTEGSLVVARGTLADARAAREAGLAAGVDVAAAQSRVADLEGRAAEAHASQQKALQTLRIQLGLPADAALELAPTPLALPAEATAPPPAVARLVAAAEARAHEREAVERGFWPTLDVFATGAYADPRTFVETDAGLTWQVGARAAWPLFDGDQRRRRARQLDAEEAAARAGASAAVEQQAIARDDADARLRAAAASAEAAERRVQAAQTYVTAAQAGEAAGTARRRDVEQAEDRLDAARLALAQSRFDAARARADRLLADGIASTPDLRDPP